MAHSRLWIYQYGQTILTEVLCEVNVAVLFHQIIWKTLVQADKLSWSQRTRKKSWLNNLCATDEGGENKMSESFKKLFLMKIICHYYCISWDKGINSHGSERLCQGHKLNLRSGRNGFCWIVVSKVYALLLSCSPLWYGCEIYCWYLSIIIVSRAVWLRPVDDYIKGSIEPDLITLLHDSSGQVAFLQVLTYNFSTPSSKMLVLA